MTPARSREDELCLLLARGKLSSEERVRTLQFLATPLQWPLILERAYSHQVYPLLYRNLLELGFPGVPHEVQTELKSAYLANGFRNQLLAEELARLLKSLGEAGIPVIPLKGVTLAQSLFGDPAARVCSDIRVTVGLKLRDQFAARIHAGVGDDRDLAVEGKRLALVLGLVGRLQKRVAEADVAVNPDFLGVGAAERMEAVICRRWRSTGDPSKCTIPTIPLIQDFLPGRT